MILKIPVESIKGHFSGLLSNTTSIYMVVAGEKATEIVTINTDEVRFDYPLNGIDSRVSYSTLEADEEVADMLTAADVVASPYDRDSESFNILDESGGTATATVIPWSSFLFAIASSTSGESWMWYTKGGKTVKALVDYTLDELVTLATP